MAATNVLTTVNYDLSDFRTCSSSSAAEAMACMWALAPTTSLEKDLILSMEEKTSPAASGDIEQHMP